MNLRPTFLGFETARRGLAVSQKGLDITGQNLVNRDTPGYTRQRVDLISVAPSSYRSRYATMRTGLAGQGVDISGIGQTRDSFLDKRFRDEYADAGYYSQMSAITSDIEQALQEYHPDAGLLNALSEISEALQNFSSNSDSPTHANIVATAFKNITQVLHQFDAKLNNVAEQHKFDLGISVDSYNNALERIAALNKIIAEDISAYGSRGSYYGPNELLDERNLLLDEISRYADLDATAEADGTVTVKVNGHTAVSGNKAEIINYTRNSDGTVSINWQSNGKPVKLTTGVLKASTELINGRGANARAATESTERGILYYKDKIDAFARSLVKVANNILPDYNDPTQMKALMGAKIKDAAGNYVVDPDALVTAANISISDAWAKDSSYFIYRENNKENKYALALNQALTTGVETFGATGESFSGTFQEFVQDYVGICGTDKAFYDGRFSAAGSIADTLLDSRDQVSGVSQDEETTNMLLYQKSFQAVSRLMTALDEALDVLINRTGRVGL